MQEAEPVQKAPIKRECGKCQACCFALPVNSAAVTKPPYMACEHQCSKGCAIYENRPMPCAVYRCMWKLGWGEKRHRPDRLGLLVESPGHGCGIYVKETKPGALRSKEGHKIIKGLAHQAPAFITHYLDDHAGTFTGTQEDLERIVANIAALPGSLGDAARAKLTERASNLTEALEEEAGE